MCLPTFGCEMVHLVRRNVHHRVWTVGSRRHRGYCIRVGRASWPLRVATVRRVSNLGAVARKVEDLS
jgi:hypothetical protein